MGCAQSLGAMEARRCAIGRSTDYPIVEHPGYKAIYEKWQCMPEREIELTEWDREQWADKKGPDVERLMDDLALVDVGFVVECLEAGVPLPRQQEVPRGAFINKENSACIKKTLSAGMLSILVLSYPWLDRGHPDKHLFVGKKLLNILQVFLSQARKEGEHCTVGMMMDFMCMPQKTRGGGDDRTDEQKKRFCRALGAINQWYVNEHTPVIVFDVDMPGVDSGHSNLRPYHQRGWCQFECRASGLIKNSRCFWSLKGYEAHGSPGKFVDATKAATTGVLRKPPMPPPEFAEMLREGVRTGEIAFTAGADLDKVIQQYELAFARAFSDTEVLLFGYLGWSDDEFKQLAAALAYAKSNDLLKKTTVVSIVGNKHSEKGKRAVNEAIAGLKITLKDW